MPKQLMATDMERCDSGIKTVLYVNHDSQGISTDGSTIMTALSLLRIVTSRVKYAACVRRGVRQACKGAEMRS